MKKAVDVAKKLKEKTTAFNTPDSIESKDTQFVNDDVLKNAAADTELQSAIVKNDWRQLVFNKNFIEILKNQDITDKLLNR